MASPILETIEQQSRALAVQQTSKRLLGALIQRSQYVGEVFSIGYETALVQIHDFHRQRVGGIPSLCFLVATRLNPEEDFNYADEDASIILLRVMDAAPLPNEADALRVRVETAQRVSGEPDLQWDHAGAMDASTHNLLSFAGVKCRVIGTFYLDHSPRTHREGQLVLRFGSDISNYYPNRGLKVYKPNGAALSSIVNYRDPDRTDSLTNQAVTVGDVRYASTNRAFQGIADVGVDLVPTDLLGQKSALFGMTRIGKSNTTKVIIKSVFDLRHHDVFPWRVGQIVFDPDGEYANENVQDQNSARNPSAIKNVWASDPRGRSDDVVTYGITEHPDDPGRRLMLLNFFEKMNLQTGKTIIDSTLADDNTKFIQNFRQVVFEHPEENDRSAMTRYNRRVVVYRALLAKAGFAVPSDLQPDINNLFNAKLLEAMRETDNPDYESSAQTLAKEHPTWSQLADAFVHLEDFIAGGKSGYSEFDKWYMNRPGGSGDSWADEDLKKLLTMFRYPNGARQIGKARTHHSATTDQDYVDLVYEDLLNGRLVIFDQSAGEPEINASSSERIMWKIFRNNQEKFRRGLEPVSILVYVEEAHNLLPKGSDEDLRDVWVRTAKEGAKYNIGMVYATQEVSSIQRNILKNTANWFIGHLNNTDETKEICKYYDFADFEASIRRAQDRGFLRVKTLSNMFVVPVQIRKFEV